MFSVTAMQILSRRPNGNCRSLPWCWLWDDHSTRVNTNIPKKTKKTAEVIISLILCNIWQCEIVCKLIIEAKYRLVPKSVTLNDLDSMTANLCYLCGSWASCTQWVKKLCHYTFVHNFDKCWPIFKIFLLLYLQEICNKTHAIFPTSP